MQYFVWFLCVKRIPIRSRHYACWCKHIKNSLAYELFYTGFHILSVKVFLYSEQGCLYATMSSQPKLAGYRDFHFQLTF